MSSIAVIYWSMTGNTQAMAEAIAQGAREAGAQVDVFSVDQVGVDQVLEYDQLALGCPAMGAEVLEESEFEPFFSQLEGRLSGKSVALFGSYGWGDGQWMRDWEEDWTGAVPSEPPWPHPETAERKQIHSRPSRRILRRLGREFS